MYDKASLCKKIHDIYPEIGECEKDLNVAWDNERSVWEVSFKKNGQPIRHYLEEGDATPCLEAGQCIGLGIEFGQFL